MDKKKYVVYIEETVVNSFDVEANSLEEALEIGRKKYRDGEFVVESETPLEVIAQATTEDASEMTPWEEI